MPANYTINWPTFERYKDKVGEKVLRLAVTEMRLVAMRNVSYGRYSKGHLRTSIYGTVTKTPFGWKGQVGSRLRYAASVEEGAAPHIIRPRAISLGGGLYAGGVRGGYLHFYWHKHGTWVFAKKVHHPGQKGKHYIRNALISVGRRRNFRVILH